jgi:hypothetical protein
MTFGGGIIQDNSPGAVIESGETERNKRVGRELLNFLQQPDQFT